MWTTIVDHHRSTNTAEIGVQVPFRPLGVQVSRCAIASARPDFCQTSTGALATALVQCLSW